MSDIRESFEKWWMHEMGESAELEENRLFKIAAWKAWEVAYQAGAAMQKEKDAGICDDVRMGLDSDGDIAGACGAETCLDDIRSQT